MRATKIVVIGAGSASFGPSCLRDAIHCEGLSGSKLVLVDLDAEKLEVIARLAHRLSEASGAGLVIEHKTDRKQALPGAEFVITSIAVNREALCNTQVGVQKLVVEAAVTGSRQIALQAMLADPVVQSAEAGRKCLDELLAVHKAYLPRFA